MKTWPLSVTKPECPQPADTCIIVSGTILILGANITIMYNYAYLYDSPSLGWNKGSDVQKLSTVLAIVVTKLAKFPCTPRQQFPKPDIIDHK